MGELTKAFDYRHIENEDVRGKLVYFEGQLRKQFERDAISAIEKGEMLLQAHELLSNQRNGMFGQWVEQQFSITDRTARNYMNAFRVFGKTENVSVYSDSALYLLSGDSCPEAATADAMQLAKKGERITHKLARQLIERHTVEAEEVAEPEPEPVISGEALEALRRAKIEPKPTELKALAEYDETSQVLLAQSAAKGVQKLSEAVETGHVPELWEELAVVHRDAVKKLNGINRVFSKMAEDEERGGHIQHVITRIVADIRQLKATIGQATPVGEKGGKIVTKADEQRSK